MTLRPILYLFTTILIFKTTMTYTQSKPLSKRISLEVKDMPLENLFEKLQRDYQVKLVYGAKNFPENQNISIKADNISLKHFIDRVCMKTGLSYEIVDEYLIFQYKPPAPVLIRQDSLSTKVIVVSERLVPKPEEDSPSDSISTEPKELRGIEEQTIVIREITSLDSISLSLPLEIIKPMTSCKKAEIKKPKTGLSYRIALFASYDYHFFHFNTLPDKNQEYKLELSSSFGGSFSVSFSRKTFIGVGFLYTSKNFTYHRNFRILNPNDAVSIPDITSLSFSYIEVPFDFEYRVIRHRKLKISLAPGIDTAFLFDKEERTTYLTHGKPTTEYFVNQTNSFLWGPQASIRVEYPLAQSFSFFISPRYIHYIKPVNEATMHSGNDLFRFQAGIQLNIKKS